MKQIDQLAEALAPATVEVGFHPMRAPDGDGTAAPPPDSLLWRSSYAVLLAVVVPTADLEAMTTRAQAWFDVLLMDLERSERRALDAYLVLATDKRPLPEVLQRLTLDRHICRKHIVWDDAPRPPWAHLKCVPILGLPVQTAANESGDLPQPGAQLATLWTSLAEAATDADAVRAACETDE